MKPEAQRIAIAEALGCEKGYREDGTSLIYSDPFGKTFYWRETNERFDPLNDLNAMHEAEKVLGEQNKWNYGNALALMVLSKERTYFGEKEDADPNLNGMGHFALATLTATQRAEAFLRTLELWKDD